MVAQRVGLFFLYETSVITESHATPKPGAASLLLLALLKSIFYAY